MAQLIFDKKEKPICIPTCAKEHDSKVPAKIWSDEREEKSGYCSLFELVDCLCPCHDNDGELLNHEQKVWLKRRLCSTMGETYDLFLGMEIPLRWIART